jgi:hypothetical protein
MVELYRSDVEGSVNKVFAPMLVLVEQIASSRYTSGTYGNKSMWDLVIVQTPEYDPDGEVLRISYDPVHREFNFELQETASTLYKRWTRKCSTENAFRTFERFLELKKWFLVEKRTDL